MKVITGMKNWEDKIRKICGENLKQWSPQEYTNVIIRMDN
jgi:hypothetical protein